MSKREIQIRDEYITLGQLLKLTDCIDTGGQAKQFLEDTNIMVNGVRENRRGRKIYPGDEVLVEGYGHFTVVRG